LGAEHCLRSDGGSAGVLQSTEPSPSPAPYVLQRSRDRENAHLSNRPLWYSINNHLRILQSSLAGRVVFLTDQATSPYQEGFTASRRTL
jgi:hypothetical protein